MGTDIQAGKISRSIYLHIPFCLSKCSYCSFYSIGYNREELHVYTKYLQREIELYRDYLPVSSLSGGIRSIYFGGGSPALLSPAQILTILDSLCGKGTDTNACDPDIEISLEINPIQITEQFLINLRTTPVNRLSLGIQSLHDRELGFLGRRHKGSQIADKIRLCREYGYDNISLDLMYGLPDSSLEMLYANLEGYLNLAPEHISCYLLSLDEDCAMAKEAPVLADDELASEMYQLICSTLNSNGFEQYEISNFARKGYESVHNLAYWKSDNYIALGASAAGFVHPCRYQNPSDIHKYYQSVDAAETFPGGKIQESEELKSEYIMMGLRLISGLARKDYKIRFGQDIIEEKKAVLDQLKGIGMLDYDEERVWLCEAGFFVSNSIIAELI